MNFTSIEELEEAVEELFGSNCSIETDNHGQLIIHTGLKQDEDGTLLDFESEEDEDYDEDTESLDEDDDDE